MSKVAVLVVEDDPLIRLDAIDRIEEAGFTVFEAANADAAIEILTKRPEIRLVFTDVEMPGTMDGIRLAAFVRDRWPPVQIIVTSGREGISAELLPAGSLFMAKPPSWPVLIDAMRGLTAI